MTPPLGAHVSIAGGVSRAIDRGAEMGCDTIQIFVKNASQWRGKPLSTLEVDRFRAAHAASRIGTVIAHATYLVNLAATDADNLARSRETLREELDRCDRLGIPALVVHPGAHLGSGVDRGLELVAESLRRVLADRPAASARVLLEITAGQGTVLGFRLEQLATIRRLVDRPRTVGLCIDTCHAFAAGYAIHETSGYGDFLDQIAELFGADEPSCIHLNDSRHGLGERRDRHANLGRGELPLETFHRFVHEPMFQDTPMILETPLGDDGKGHARDLELLRSLSPGLRLPWTGGSC